MSGSNIISAMKILVLTKRQYMGKDLIDDGFGRFRELPLELARLGHEVKGLALSYRPSADSKSDDKDDLGTASVTWHSMNLLTGCLPRLQRYVKYALQLADTFQPDVVWACSDAYHAIFGSWLAKRMGTRCVIDLYDNFEAFAASRFPGLVPLFRHSIRTADGVTVFSRRLANHVIETYPRRKPTIVIENGIRKQLFYPQDRTQSRQNLGLPQDATIIGTAGALDSSRGIKTLFDAFEILSRESADIHLAIAGPRQYGFIIPKGSRVHDLKELPHKDVPSFVNALDVAIVCYRNSAQGEFSFPQKAYEIIACRCPIAAAAVGCIIELLHDHPNCLYEPDNPTSLASAINRQLRSRKPVEVPVPSWADSAKLLNNFLSDVCQNSTSISSNVVDR
jgi:glycosyltransferase involved in cell wall biosynthesis